MNVSIKARSFAAGIAALSLLAGTAPALTAQEPVTVTAQLSKPARKGETKAHNEARPSAAIWLTPLHPVDAPDSAAGSAFTLLQKNKQFSPHLLVVPVGSVVQFPNADPFFHNVFSLFDGRRFDLGLYEAGTTRTVKFGRAGISYIFCDIHPEMSAVVIAVVTPYYAVEDVRERFHLLDVPPGDYMLHLWVEGEDQAVLDALTRRVHISADHSDLGIIALPEAAQPPISHANKYGQTYDTHEPAIY
jgi:plastocyanin